MVPIIFTLLTLRHRVWSGPWKTMSAGIGLIALGDATFSYLTFNELYKSGNPIDLLWVSGYLVIGWAALNQIHAVSSQEESQKVA